MQILQFLALSSSHLISGSGVAALPSSEEPSADSGRSVYVPSTAPVVLAAGGGIKARLGGHGEDLRSRLRKPGGGGVKARLGGLRTADEEFEDYEEEETVSSNLGFAFFFAGNHLFFWRKFLG